jgi:hypothetical protein
MRKLKNSNGFNLWERLSKLQNQFENQYVDNNSNVEGIAENLAKYYLLMETSIWLILRLIFTTLLAEKKLGKWQKYLNPNQRLVLDYIPTLETVQN